MKAKLYTKDTEGLITAIYTTLSQKKVYQILIKGVGYRCVRESEVVKIVPLMDLNLNIRQQQAVLD